MAPVTSAAAANDSNEALIQLDGVNPSASWASVHRRDHQPTFPGVDQLVRGDAGRPGEDHRPAGRRRSDTSQPRRPPKQKKSTASTPSIGTNTDPISQRKPE